MDTIAPKTTEHRVLEMIHRHGDITVDSHINHGYGVHGESFVSLENVLTNPLEIDFMCGELAKRFVRDDIDVVVGTLTLNDRGILSTLVALHLSHLTNKGVLAYDEYKPLGADEFRFASRAREGVKGKNILIVRGVISNGYSTSRIIKTVRLCGGDVVAIGAICDMGGLSQDDLVRVRNFSSLVQFRPRRWTEKDCPLCKEDVPINTHVGTGARNRGK